MTVFEARVATEERLTAAAVPSPAADAAQLLEAALGCSRTELLLAGNRRLDRSEAERLDALVARREAREPLQHVVGYAHFYGLELQVDGRVLVPRPETERLVELVLADLEGASAPQPVVLDVGAGSGAIALAVKSELPDAEVWGADVSPAALAVAKANALRLGADVKFIESDLLAGEEARDVVGGEAGDLLANLPYLPDADAALLAPEAAADPTTALFGGPDGTALAARLVAQAWELLPAGALLALELDPRNVHQLAAELTGWQGVAVHPDLVGRSRYLVAYR
ncbi:MAG TPA: peptide chain release factor N(5)-glutamine methyltransferase [Trueperaceae bacterium]|nr:peptide chain release factor N(5)-glutamine methyltransferase [Trueperaceae bacterium]